MSLKHTYFDTVFVFLAFIAVTTKTAVAQNAEGL